MHRIEIYLPLYYNDNTAIEADKFDKTRQELIKKFGALTAMPTNPDLALQGWWVNKGITYQDRIVILRIDSEDLNLKFWSKYKNLLKRRFAQLEIYITISEISVV